MLSNYARCLSVVLTHEGGYANHPQDPGGATMKGVTQATYNAYRARKGLAPRAVRQIAEAELQEIYRTGYWNEVQGDTLPIGVDLAVFDGAVNSGPARSKGWLRSGMRQTAADTVKAICAARRSFLRGLRTWATFGRGWTRRVADIEAKGVSWALAAVPSATTSAVQAQLRVEAQAAETTASRQTSTAAGGGAVAVPVGSGATVSGDIWPWLVALAVIVGAAAVILIIKSRQNAARAEAFRAAADEVRT